MAKEWIVANRAIKFHRGINDSDVNKIARKAAKRHREILGKNPFKKIPTSELDYFNMPVYHYQGQGLEILDEIITQYCFEHKERLNSQIEESEKVRTQRYQSIKNGATFDNPITDSEDDDESEIGEEIYDENGDTDDDIDIKMVNGFICRPTEFDDIEVDNIEDIPF